MKNILNILLHKTSTKFIVLIAPFLPIPNISIKIDTETQQLLVSQQKVTSTAFLLVD